MKIRNKETGEIREVTREELQKYNLRGNTMNPMLNPIDNPSYIDPRDTGGISSLPKYGANILRSTAQQGKDILSLLNLPKTFQGLKGVAQNPRVIGDYYGEQYGRDAGSVGETLFRKGLNDPAGWVGDLAAILTLAGGAARGGASVASSAGKATSTLDDIAKAGAQVAKAGEAIDPLSNVTKLTGKAISTAPVTKFGKNTVLDTFIKRSSRQLQDKDIIASLEGKDTLASRYASQTDKIPSNMKAGIKQQLKVIGEGEKQLNTLLADSSEVANRRVPIGTIIEDLESTAENVTSSAGKNVTNAYKKQIETLKNKAKYDINNGLTLSVKDANDLKKATVDYIKKVYEGDKSSTELGASAAAMKDKADALRLAVNEVAPEVADVNNKLSTAYEMRDFFTGLRRKTPSGLQPTPMESLLLAGGSTYALPQLMAGNPIPAMWLLGSIPARRVLSSPNLPLSVLRGTQLTRQGAQNFNNALNLSTKSGKGARVIDALIPEGVR